jgi:hypothetical protein
MTKKTLPEIYREAADLVLKAGKVEGEMKNFERIEETDSAGRCLGFCTMGAVFDVAGHLDANGNFVNSYFDTTPEFLRLAGPVADRIVSSGRREAIDEEDVHERAFWTIANWNDSRNVEGKKPTAEDVAALLRETADSLEVTA